MAGSTDWEDLMNGVFGHGGRFRGAAGGKGPEKDLADAQKKLEEAAARTAAAADAAKNTDGARLLRNSEELTRQLEEQSREISRLGQGLAREMERDGLLTPAQAAAAAPAPKDSDAAFERAAQRQRAALAGREDFSAALLAAFRRPFVLGEAGEKPRNVIVLAGKAGRGRHYALTETVKALKEEWLLTGGVAWMDLALYGSPAQEKLFLQDLYAALAGPDPVLAFENAESCHPGCLALLAQLAETGSARLASRYVVQKGMLVETGTALAPGAVGTLSARGKYLVFLCPGGKRALASLLGATFASAVGDECEVPAFGKEELLAIAGRQLNGLARRTKERLGWTLTAAGEGLADLVAQKGEQGVGRLADFCDRCFAALAEHKLRGRKAAAVTLQAGENGQVLAAFDGGEPVDLLAVLPAEYTGDLAEVKAELDGIIGLREVKDYVLRLEDAVAVQRRRAAAGMKTAGVSMHMIFTGNPGTGKTTIARLVGRYLKAIGALSGGQLVEVSRADLVGRYVGHTAPLTQKVIQSALGGVLFIDEAYSLYRGEQDTFGLEAIDTLVKGMEDHRDELVVILAGYTKEMEEFLQANSGLRSRFPNKIEFPDYTGAELLAITKLTAKGRGYRLAAECDGPLLAFYDRKQAENAAENGNGRLARNTLEAAILNQGRRLAAEPDAALDELRPGDFQLDE